MYCLKRGFRITTLHVDGKFAPLKTMIKSVPAGPMLNIASRNEHVPDIKRRIRMIKELCRAIQHGLLCMRIPKILMINIVLNVVNMLNYFPTKGGISNTLIPKIIMSDETLDYQKHLCIQIGQYFQVHKEYSPRNIKATSNRGAIFLGPSGNLQGGFKFLALKFAKTLSG